MRLGLIGNRSKEEVAQIARDLMSWLAEHGVDVLIDQQMGQVLGERSVPMRMWPEMDVRFIVVLGGDGTLLRAAKRTVDLGIPLLGVNMGQLGFLTEVEVSDLYEDLPHFLQGRYRKDRRNHIVATIAREADDSTVAEYLALNDVVIGKGSFSRMINVRTWVDDSSLGAYPADGVILSTATGSTAYSLSAGGPVIHPKLETLLVSPVCPHSFYARPVVLSKDQVVRVKATVRIRGTPIVTVDGNEGRRLEGNEYVRARLSEAVVTLMRRPEWDFYEVLRKKLYQSEERLWEDDL